jgi:hypothetical protein
VCDLAAHAGNTKVPHCYLTKEDDSLAQPWGLDFPTGNLWLNPEFKQIAPWAKKCVEESARRQGLILMLTPASVGTDWYLEHVHRKALVIPLLGRMIFDGTPPSPKSGKPEPYPKDLMLSVFGMGIVGFEPWRWKEAA